MWRIALAALGALVLASCALTPRQSAVSPGSGAASAVGVSVRLRGPLGAPTYRADRLYLALVADGELAPDGKVVASNYSVDGRVYFLNLPAGEYALVAAGFMLRKPLDDGSIYLVFFDADLVGRNRTMVEPGHFNHLGSLSVDMKMFVCPKDSDLVQLRFAQIIAPDVPKCGFGGLISRAIGNGVYLGGSFYPGGAVLYPYRGYAAPAQPERRTDSVLRAKKDLEGTGWERILDGR